MNVLFNKYKWMTLVTGIIFLIAAALVIVLAITNVSTLSNAISYILAAFMFLLGGIIVFSAILEINGKGVNYPLFIGALVIAIGILLIVKPDIVSGIVVQLIALIAISFGVVEVGKGVKLVLTKCGVIDYVLSFVLGAIMIALGIVILLNQANVLMFVYILIGAVLALYGGLKVFTGIKLLRVK